MPKRSKSKAYTNQMNRVAKRLNPGKSTASTNPNRIAPGKVGNGFFRSKQKIKLLNMYNKKPDLEKMNEIRAEPVRVEPDRKWFGNVRTIDPKTLDKYKTDLLLYKKNPYKFLLNKRKIDL